MQKRVRHVLVLLLLAAVLAALVFLPRLLRQPSHSEADIPASHVHHENMGASESTDRCRLNEGACSVMVAPALHAIFEISPQPIPTMTPVRLTAHFHGYAPQRVQVVLEGRDMFMGQTRVLLLPQGQGRFEGELIVPACEMDAKMVWLANFEIDGESEDHQVTLELQALGQSGDSATESP